MADLVLDSAIRDWVLIPIIIIMFLMGVFRNNVTKLLRTEKPPDAATVQQQSALARSRRLRANSKYIPQSAFNNRKHHLTNKETGVFSQKVESANNPMSMMTDPNMMNNMMRGNLAMMVPQVFMMGVVNYFFSGFVLGKVPFPLTPSFKSMLQRGLNLSTLDVTYVTSMSWYFLVMFGMRGLFSLVLGADNDTDDAKMMQNQMNGGMAGGQPGQPVDMGKLYAAEKENLLLVEHDWYIDSAEDRLLHPRKFAKQN